MQTQLHSVCCPKVFSLEQKRHIRWKFSWDENHLFYLWKTYNISPTGIKDTMLRSEREGFINEQRYIPVKALQRGPDLAAADMILNFNGRVKFNNDDVWYKTYEKGTSPLPQSFRPDLKLEAVDLADSNWMLTGMDHLHGCEHVVFVSLARCKYVTDWFIAQLVLHCPNLKYLDVSGCPEITDATMEMAYKFRHLQILNITDCQGIKQGEVFSVFLEDLLPELIIIGVDSLSKMELPLHEYEQQNSRFLNLGMSASIPEQIVGLRSETSEKSTVVNCKLNMSDSVELKVEPLKTESVC